MKRRALGSRQLLAAALFLAFVSGCSSSGGTPSAPVQPAGVLARGKIAHVVIIVQENRTFDDLYGGFPGGPTPFPGADSHVPASLALEQTGYDTDIPSNDHDVFRCLADYNFSLATWQQLKNGVWPTSPIACPTSSALTNPDANFGKDGAALTIIAQSHRTAYWSIAQEYELGDRFYSVNGTNSFPAHQFVVALRSQDDAGDAITDQPTLASPTPIPLVPTPTPAPSGLLPTPTPVPTITLGPTPVPAGQSLGCINVGSDSFIQTPVLDTTSGFTRWQTEEGPQGACWGGLTFGDRLNAAGVGWTHYSTDNVSGVFDGFINFKSWYRAAQAPPGSNFRMSRTDLVTDLAANRLLQFTWVKPPCVYLSDHPGRSQAKDGGQDWVATVINAIGNNPDLWPNTVIFVVWDDWGGFYDHAPLPPGGTSNGSLTPGPRQPVLVISPYNRKAGLVVHTEANYASILKFAEDLYGVPPLNELDANARDLIPFFDFSRRSPAPFTPIPTHGDPSGECLTNTGTPITDIDR